jgi:hypothetical protein
VADPAVVEALRFQRRAVTRRSLASPLYAALLDVALADLAEGGPCAAVLARAPDDVDPVPDALALRFLGGVQRLVLTGRAPDLAGWFPTAGGDRPAWLGGEGGAVDADLAAAFRATVAAHADELAEALRLPVQTNEVGRCATLAVGFAALLRRHRLPLRLLEVGSSAGLNLRWDRWRYESGDSAWGDPAAPLRFGEGVYREPFPDVSAPLGPGEAVVERRGCDTSPIDPTTAEGTVLLRSFVWPDQAERHARLDAALAVAAEVPAVVERADADAFVAAHLAERRPGCTTVVFHSIVWQYLPDDRRAGILDAVAAAGAAATADAPVAWLRMEPGDDPAEAAELRLATWPGGDDELLALSGYHGRPVWVPR